METLTPRMMFWNLLTFHAALVTKTCGLYLYCVRHGTLTPYQNIYIYVYIYIYMLTFQPPVVQTMTLFGNRVTANIIKMRSYWSKVGSWSHRTGVLIRRGDQDTDTEGRNCRVKMQAETCMVLPPPRDTWGKGRKNPSLLASKQAWSCWQTPWFWTSGLQDYEIIDSCCVKTSGWWYFVMAAVGG